MTPIPHSICTADVRKVFEKVERCRSSFDQIKPKCGTPSSNAPQEPVQIVYLFSGHSINETLSLHMHNSYLRSSFSLILRISLFLNKLQNVIKLKPNNTNTTIPVTRLRRKKTATAIEQKIKQTLYSPITTPR